MKKMFAMILVFLLMIPAALAEEPAFTVYAPQKAHVVFNLPGNATTGYMWTVQAYNENLISFPQPEGEYIMDANAVAPDGETFAGAGGAWVFDAIAEAPGKGLIVFRYARNWEKEQADEKVYFAQVDDNGFMNILDVTGLEQMEAKVESRDDKEYFLLLTAEAFGQVRANYDPEMMPSLPEQGQNITLFYNGMMTRSIPGQIFMEAWMAE